MSLTWEEKWAAGKTRWDQGSAHPVLVDFLRRESDNLIPKEGTAVVPACGRGYDVHALASHGLNALGVEISPTAVHEARKWLSTQSSPSGSANVIEADFFKWAQGSANHADVILDYTFLCALPPSERGRWRESLASLAVKSPGTALITIMFPLNVPPEQAEGPPWPLTVELYHELLDENWELVHLEDIDKATNGRHTGPPGEEKLGVWKWRGSM